jgi:cell division protein FtsI/penicillin-binding protein 2
MRPVYFLLPRFYAILLVLPGFALLGVQLWWVHVDRSAYLRKRAAEARLYQFEEVAERGLITDKRGVVFARSVEVWDVGVDAHAMAEQEKKIIKSRLLRQEREEGAPRSNTARLARRRRTEEAVARERAERIRIVADILKLQPDAVAHAFEPTYIPFTPKPAPTPATPASSASALAATPEDTLGDPPFAPLAVACKWALEKSGISEKLKAVAPPPDRVPKRWAALAKDIDLATKDLLEERLRPVWYPEINDPKARLETKIRLRNERIPGMTFNRKFIRAYPQGATAAPLIGFLGTDGKPFMGVERAANWCLNGESGFILSLKDGRGREMPEFRRYMAPATPGMKVELTLDATVQEICEEEAARAIARYSPKFIAIIVSEPETGKLLALANLPSFDPANYADKALSPQANHTNRALSAHYEPGSVFKIVPISMALNERAVDMDTVFDASNAPVLTWGSKRHSYLHLSYRGRMCRVPGRPEWNRVRKLNEVVRSSSNFGSVMAAMKVTEAPGGEEKFQQYVQAFGFGQPTGLAALAGCSETPGSIPKAGTKSWSNDTISSLPVGHGIDVNPVQLHYAMATIANQGRLMAPLLINRIVARGSLTGAPANADGDADANAINSANNIAAAAGKADGTAPADVLHQYLPIERGRPITPQTAKKMRLLLREVCVKGGTASGTDIEGYELAGKTGTTQKIVEGSDGERTYSTKHHAVTFSGFFPASAPQFVITVVLDDPTMPPEEAGKDTGGLVAAPIFKNVAQGIIDRLQIPPPAAAAAAQTGTDPGEDADATPVAAESLYEIFP